MGKNTGDVFNRLPGVYYIEQKRKQLQEYHDDLFGMSIDCASKKLISKAEEFLGKKVTGDIVDFAMNFEEDIAIMHDGVLNAICFCFPSSWIPKSAIGKTLEQIHKPVADGDHLRRVSSKLSKTMADPVLGSFRRYVWAITKVPELSNHPNTKKKYKDIELSFSNLFFRLETQTTMPLKDGSTSLFFVKVEVVPLREVWNPIILNSINSMSSDVLDYKNMREIKHLLNENEKFNKYILKNEYYDILD